MVTSGSENDALYILQEAERLCKHWQVEDARKISLKAKLALRQSERDKLRDDNKKLQTIFTKSKAQIASMMYRQDAINQQLKGYTDVLDLIRDMASTSCNETIGLLPPERMAHAAKLYADFEKNVGFLQRRSRSSGRLSAEISYDTTDDNLLSAFDPAHDLNQNSMGGNSSKLVIFALFLLVIACILYSLVRITSLLVYCCVF
jgi:hypothetical protein